LTEQIEQAVAERAGVSIAVEDSGGRLILSGRVDTTGAKQAAEDVARTLAGERRIDNDLEVEQVVPVEVSDFHVGDAPAVAVPESVEEIRDMGAEIDADITGREVSTSALEMSGVDLAEEGESTTFPPTDPVLTSDVHGNVQVLGGFTPTSTADVGVAPSASDAQLGDEAIAEAVVRELREDAMTTALRIDVQVREGVVYLRGSVEGMEDASAAEEVASRVPGVTNVVEELRVRQV
jgi:osmotically-inducible protein OsmY